MVPPCRSASSPLYAHTTPPTPPSQPRPALRPRWEAPHRDNVQAFEEKFNSFLMVCGADAAEEVATRRCEIAALGETKLVQSDRHRHTAAWYVQEPQRWAGLAALKAFGEEGAPGTYVFELIACGSDGAPMPT